MDHTRREFIAGAGALIASAAVPSSVFGAATRRTRLILLGTAGGPRTQRTRCASSQAIVVGDRTYVVDCGDGVAMQVVRAGVALTSLRHVFITHQHFDHNADYGNLLMLAWFAGKRSRIDAWGPPPLENMTRQFFEMNRLDIEARMQDEIRVDPRPLMHAHDIAKDGVVLDDDGVRVTCARVDHPPLDDAFAYRFDTPGRSIVFSGDTRRSDALVQLARGADVLVHEAMYVPAVANLVRRIPNAESLAKSIISHHTAVEDVGRVATAAGVKMLVLSHLVPADDGEVTEAMWRAAAAKTFAGRIIVGRDLLEI